MHLPHTRAIVDAINGDRRCPACGKRPRITDQLGMADHMYALVAFCHGSIERESFDLEVARYDADRVYRKIADWVRRVFVLDALPDVRELLHYNRGTLPGVVS